MSKETSKWLNTMTRIGYGPAWHYDENEQGETPNTFEGPVPIESVRELFGKIKVTEGTPTVTYESDGTTVSLPCADRKAILRPTGTFGDDDAGEVFGFFKTDYQLHDYAETLLDGPANILDDGLTIRSAGMLKGGAVAWVQVSLPETVTVEGVEFAAFLNAMTSVNGTLATMYSVGAKVIVCDNTLSASRHETSKSGRQTKIRHTKNSGMKISNVRSALDLVFKVQEDFSVKIKELTAIDVRERQWEEFVKLHVELTDPKTGEMKTGRGLTRAENQRDQLELLYRTDERVTPWSGTAFGVLQAVNTYDHHVRLVHTGTDRAERNAYDMLTGKWDERDAKTLETLDKVLALA